MVICTFGACMRSVCLGGSEVCRAEGRGGNRRYGWEDYSCPRTVLAEAGCCCQVLVCAEPLPTLPAASRENMSDPARADQLGAKGEIRLIELLRESERHPAPGSILLMC